MQTIKVQVTGTAPLLMHAYRTNGDGTSSTMKGEELSPREQAERHLWVDGDGKPIIPQRALWLALVEGGKFHKQGKRQLTTGAGSILAGCISLDGVAFPLKHKKPWEVDSVAVPNKMGNRVPLHRPRFDEWGVDFEIEYDDEMITDTLLRKCCDDAFKRVGLGSNRPGRGGCNGKATITVWQNDTKQKRIKK